MFSVHPSPEVQRAIVALADALCTHERCTGRQSVVIIREEAGFGLRLMSGKPIADDDVTDERVLATVL